MVAVWSVRELLNFIKKYLRVLKMNKSFMDLERNKGE